MEPLSDELRFSLPIYLSIYLSIYHSLRVQVSTESQRELFHAALAAAEDWLYMDGDGEPAKVFKERLAELRAQGNPIESRAKVSVEAGVGAVCGTVRCAWRGSVPQRPFKLVQAVALT